MDINNILKIPLERVAEYLLRDPLSWEGVSLFYIYPRDDVEKQSARTASEQYVSKNPDALFFENPIWGYLFLGAKNAPEPGNASSYFCLWVENIASEQELVRNTLSRMVTNPQADTKKSPPYSILVVEDEPLLNKMIAHHLQQFGTVLTTNNYHEAVANYMVQTPQLVFLDINYHGDDMDGFDALRNILIYDKDAFIVMVSGDGRIETRLQSFALGAQGFIVKPFRPIDFSHYLTRLGLES